MWGAWPGPPPGAIHALLSACWRGCLAPRCLFLYLLKAGDNITHLAGSSAAWVRKCSGRGSCSYHPSQRGLDPGTGEGLRRRCACTCVCLCVCVALSVSLLP